MNRSRLCVAGLALLLLVFLRASRASAQSDPNAGSGTFAGWSTNGPAVYRLYSRTIQTDPGPGLSYPMPSTNLPVELRRDLLIFRAAANVTVVMQTNKVFDHLLTESLNYAVWTNFIAHTNGRNTAVWSVRSFPVGWPARPPIVEWNTSSLVWGMKGLTR